MALTYGMSVKEFWEDDPDLFWAYRFSYIEKVKNEQELYNSNAWLQGAYFYEAISVALTNAFSKTKVNYAKCPYGMEKEYEKQNANNESDLLVAKLKNRVLEVQKIFKSSTADKEETTQKGGEKNK